MTLLLHSMPFSQVMSQFILPLYDQKKKKKMGSIQFQSLSKEQRRNGEYLLLNICSFLWWEIIRSFSKNPNYENLNVRIEYFLLLFWLTKEKRRKNTFNSFSLIRNEPYQKVGCFAQ